MYKNDMCGQRYIDKGRKKKVRGVESSLFCIVTYARESGAGRDNEQNGQKRRMHEYK